MDFGLFVLSGIAVGLVFVLAPLAVLSIIKIRTRVARGFLTLYALGLVGTALTLRWTYQIHYLDEPLWEASREGDIKQVQRLLKEGASPNDSFESTTALEEANKRGDREIAALLRQAGARD